jgi:hypothetical protein
MTNKVSSRLKATVAVAAIVAQLAALPGTAFAFCGFYVAKADSKLFNKSSKVVLVRDGNTTTMTMARLLRRAQRIRRRFSAAYRAQAIGWSR